MEARQPGHVEERFLSEIIHTVSSSLDLSEVLSSVVRLLSDASTVHACFVYLPDEQGERLVLRAASEPYTQLVRQISLGRGEGLAGWAFEHREAVFIREGALADPRMVYVPQLEEERFESIVCVPLLSRAGPAIGVIVAHTEAPREFTPSEADFLTAAANLVAGAIENARLYEEVQQRVGDLELLVELGEVVARAATLAELLPAVAAGARRLVRASACHLYLVAGGGDELVLRSSSPPTAHAPATLGLSQLGREVAHRPPRLSLPLVANGELVGLLVAEGTLHVALGRALASQLATAVKKIDLIERLTEKNLVRDFLQELATGTLSAALEERAARVGIDLADSFLVLEAVPPSEELEQALALPGALVDRQDTYLRAVVPVGEGGEPRAVARLEAVQARLGRPTTIGVSRPCSGAASFQAGFEEAHDARVGATFIHPAPGVLTYEQLGPYKYLLRLSLGAAGRDRHREAVARIAEYDRQRSTDLLGTLEAFLAGRGQISATARTLYVHQNTLRQRLRRIGEISGLDLRTEDLLLLEMAVKLVRMDSARPDGA